ncbi:MAG: hypothetical protein ACLTRS_11870 [Lachnospiraceae bacterium]
MEQHVDSDGFSGGGWQTSNRQTETRVAHSKKAGPVWIYLHLQVPAFLY